MLNGGYMKNESNSNEIPKDFTVTMALMDLLPCLFFAGSCFILSGFIDNTLFFAGAMLCVLAGLFKTAWKFVIALAKKNIWILNRQMRFLMPTGFIMMIISIVISRDKIELAAIAKALMSLPSAVFFILAIAGIIMMTYYAKHGDMFDARMNWIEELTNAFAQGFVFLGLLFL